MGFAIGDQVMHPAHGLGEITAIKHIEFVEGFKHYYEISISEASLQLNIPMNMMETLGIRPIMGENKLHTVLQVLSESPAALDDHYRFRQASVEKQLRSGDPLAWAEAVRDLEARRQAETLTRRDHQLLNEALALLTAEVAATLAVSQAEAMSTIQSALALQTPTAQSA